MKKISHPIEDLELMAYLDGELPRERAAAAAAHLESCRQCQDVAAELRGVSQELAAWQIESSDSKITPQMLIALDEHVRAQEAAPQYHRSRRSTIFRNPRLWALGFTAAVAVLVIVAISIPNLMMSRYAVREVQSPREFADYSSSTRADTTRSAGLISQTQNGSFGRYASRSGVAGKVQTHLQSLGDVLEPTGPMVIRTAELALNTNDVEHARSQMEAILKRHNGYLGQLNVSGASESARTLNATLRVPADQLDATMAELKGLGRVESESQKGEEVSQQYVDLQARLTNARNSEQRLTQLLQRAGKLADVLAVEEQIESVREEIERMDAEKKNLAKQIAFSTLKVTMAEDFKQRVHVVPNSTSTRVRNAAVEGYEAMVAGLINVLVFFASAGPSILLWGAILFFPVRILWKRWRKRNII